MGELAVKTHDFVKRLQRSDDKTKRRYVVGFSAGLMAVVIFLWLVYLNLTIPQAVPEATVAATTTTAAAAPASASPAGPSFFGTLGRGAAIVWEDITKGFGNVGGAVGGAWQGFQKQIQKTNTFELNATSTNQ